MIVLLFFVYHYSLIFHISCLPFNFDKLPVLYEILDDCKDCRRDKIDTYTTRCTVDK